MFKDSKCHKCGKRTPCKGEEASHTGWIETDSSSSAHTEDVIFQVGAYSYRVEVQINICDYGN